MKVLHRDIFSSTTIVYRCRRILAEVIAPRSIDPPRVSRPGPALLGARFCFSPGTTSASSSPYDPRANTLRADVAFAPSAPATRCTTSPRLTRALVSSVLASLSSEVTARTSPISLRRAVSSTIVVWGGCSALEEVGGSDASCAGGVITRRFDLKRAGRGDGEMRGAARAGLPGNAPRSGR